MVTISINSKAYNILTLEELTIKHLIDLRKCNGQPLELLTWAFGKEPLLKSGKTTEREVAAALSLIDTLLEQVYGWMASDERVRVPGKITVLGLEIKCKSGLLSELPYWGTVRCKEAMNEVIATGVMDFTDKIPEILAHYLYEKITRNKYDEVKANEFIEVVNEIPMIQAVQLGNFFLLKQIRQFQDNKSSWLTRLILMKKRLALRFSRNTGILTT